MPENDKESMIFRCPVCYARENDVVLHQRGEQFYCVKCSFTGSREKIQEMYRDLQKKYRNRTIRYTLEQLENM